jgi:hypothetical protein
MQLRYGSFLFPVNQVRIETDQQHLLSDAKIVYAYRIQFKVSGYLLLSDTTLTGAAAQSNLSQQSANLDRALKIPFQDLILLQDDNSPSSTSYVNSQSYSGVIITSGPSFGNPGGNDYATQRAFSFSGFVEYAASPVNTVTSFRESLTLSGGLHVRIAKRAINGPPQMQRPYNQTEYLAVQAGQAEAFRAYPTIPAPLFPAALAEAPVIRYTSPVRSATNFEKWGVTWEYRFISDTPLIGLPNLWTTV